MDLLHHLLRSPAGVRVLSLVAHGDDEVIGCGGLLSRFVAGGATVRVHFACLADAVREAESRRSCAKLGVEIDSDHMPDRGAWMDQHRSDLYRRYVEIIRGFRPHLVVMHEPTNDGNPDHRAVGSTALEALEFATHGPNGWTGVQLALGFEIHALLPFPATIVDVSSVWDRVIAAMNEHRSQIEAPHKAGYYLEFLDARSRLRGVQGGCERGEAYSLLSFPTLGNFNRGPAEQ